MTQPIDLRSDTVTRPTAAMRAAMASAEVGDDVYGEDPTVRALEQAVAARLGKAAGLLVPSGTMSNQIAIWLHTQPGDDVIVPAGAHVMEFESGAAAALSGVQFRALGPGDGTMTVAEVNEVLNLSDPYRPLSRLLVIENSHNRAGGRIVPQTTIEGLAALARQHQLRFHLDGARLMNVHVKTGIPLDQLARPFDTISICLSKGLGAPVGSVLVGSAEAIARARRRRKMLGGGMRQAGVIAAAGLYALEHHIDRLAEDHRRARELALQLAGIRGIEIDVAKVDTNIVLIHLTQACPHDINLVIEVARQRGVLISAINSRCLRLVTHLDIRDADVERGSAVLTQIFHS